MNFCSGLRGRSQNVGCEMRIRDLEVIFQYLSCRNSAAMYFITRHIGIDAVPVKIFDVELKTSKNL